MKFAKKMLALVLIALPILAVAQMTSSTKIVGQVPFPFTVGNKHIPAGECIVERSPETPRVLVIHNFAAKLSLFTPAKLSQGRKASNTYALVFHKYGNQAFLAGIKVAGGRTAYEIQESPAEAELRAQNIPATEEILLASAK